MPKDQPTSEQMELPVTYVPTEEDQALASFADLVAASRDEAVVSGAALGGDAYTRLDRDQKRQLVDVMFIVEDFELRDGDNGEYAIVKVVTEKSERYSFTDGGAGIVPALLKVPQGRKVFCRHGLRASDYEFNGRPATTYYLT